MPQHEAHLATYLGKFSSRLFYNTIRTNKWHMLEANVSEFAQVDNKSSEVS